MSPPNRMNSHLDDSVNLVTPEKSTVLIKHHKINQLFRERMNAESVVFDQQKQEEEDIHPVFDPEEEEEDAHLMDSVSSIESSSGANLLRRLREEMKSREAKS
jgi:hypothetical protein